MSKRTTLVICGLLMVAIIVSSVSAMTINHVGSEQQDKACNMVVKMLNTHNILAPFMDIPSIPYPEYCTIERGSLRY